MSPEQAKGKPADRRSDIWAFGCVLYEMVTGTRLFEGESVTEVLASVLRDAPPLQRAPAALRPILARCLTANPRDRHRERRRQTGSEPPSQARGDGGVCDPALVDVLQRSSVVGVDETGRLDLPGVEWGIWSSEPSKLLWVAGGQLVEGSPGDASRRLRDWPDSLGRPSELSPDGTTILSTIPGGPSLLVPISGSDEALTVVESPRTSGLSFSPDGSWFAYADSQFVYAQPVNGFGARRQISLGLCPVWRTDGREILCRCGPERDVWSIPVVAGGAGMQFGTPQRLFGGLRPAPGTVSASHMLAVTRDGKRIFALQGVEQPEADVINITMGRFN